MRIAIVGTGISGLVVAHELHRDHDLTIFEAGREPGGHTHTVTVDTDEGTFAVDTGFIVFNTRNYPGFTRLLSELGVASKPSEMTFSVQDGRSGLEYRASSLDTFFAQRLNLLRPRFHRMLLDILRFRGDARRLLTSDDSSTLGELVAARGYSPEFVDQFLLPMGASIWSAAPAAMRDFPARYFARFFANHGFLQMTGQPEWRVVEGGSSAYVQSLITPFRDRVRLLSPVRAVRRAPGYVEVRAGDNSWERFDRVVIATHSDQALSMLTDASTDEKSVLGSIGYQPNDVVLHTDERLLPRRRKAWASWNNYIPQDPEERVTVTYNMNILQGLEARRQFLVTLNRSEAIDPARVLGQFLYHHPVYTKAAIAAQRRHGEIDGVARTHFCGAYWGFGFHEDGVQSGLTVARRIADRATRPEATMRRGAA